MARTLHVTVAGAFTSSEIETAKGDNSDHTQCNRQQAAGNPNDYVTVHVNDVTLHAV